jgi:hypothetical protein
MPFWPERGLTGFTQPRGKCRDEGAWTHRWGEKLACLLRCVVGELTQVCSSGAHDKVAGGVLKILVRIRLPRGQGCKELANGHRLPGVRYWQIYWQIRGSMGSAGVSSVSGSAT